MLLLSFTIRRSILSNGRFRTFSPAFSTCNRQETSLRSPTPHDEKVLLSLMNNRPGSVVNDDDILPKYNEDWTVSVNTCWLQYP